MVLTEAVALWQEMIAGYSGLFGALVVILVGFGAIELVVRTFMYGVRGGR
ncbi:hypothetical protein CCP3SC15_1240016 [Gammaproteobacteria bacterium]